jgi:cobalamin biosynthesis protein CobT
MDRIYNILNNIQNQLTSSQKTYDGQKRSDLKNSDFLFPETKSFPIVSPSDVKDAISNYGRMRGDMTYDAFLRKLYNFCKKKGKEFVAALPQASKDKLGIKSNADDTFDLRTFTYDDLSNDEEDSSVIENEELIKELYDMSLSSLKSINVHVQGILNAIDNNNMDVKDNLTEAWLQGKIAVVADYVRQIHDFLMFSEESDDIVSDNETAAKKTAKKKKAQKLFLHNFPFLHYSAPTTNREPKENENENEENKESPPSAPETSEEESEESEAPSAVSKTGLWDNIRKKKEREGKNYKPAKTQKQGRPDPDTWNELTKKTKDDKK